MSPPRTCSVVLVGGFATVVWALGPMARSLGERGYDVTPVAVGAGMGCGARAVDDLVETIVAVEERTGERVDLLWSPRAHDAVADALVRVVEPAVPAVA